MNWAGFKTMRQTFVIMFAIICVSCIRKAVSGPALKISECDIYAAEGKTGLADDGRQLTVLDCSAQFGRLVLTKMSQISDFQRPFVGFWWSENHAIRSIAVEDLRGLVNIR